MNAIPANIDIAHKHMKAKSVGKVRDFKNLNPLKDICPCCGNVIEKESLSLNMDLKDLGMLGSGISLYFFYIKFCVYFLVIIGVVSTIFNSSANNFIGDREFAPFYSNRIAQGWLNFVCTLILIVACSRLRQEMKKLSEQIDIDNITPSDFTVALTNLSHNTTEKEIEAWLQFQAPSLKLEISKIVFAYDIEVFVSLKQEQQNLLTKRVNEKTRMERTGNTDQRILVQLTSRLEVVENKLENQENGMVNN